MSPLRRLRESGDGRHGCVALRALGRVDEDRAVFADVDLHVVVGFEAADRLAALADHHADELGVDLHRRDPGADPRAGLRLADRLGHLGEDLGACPLRLRQRVPHDVLRHAGDLDVHLEGGDAILRAGHLKSMSPR